MEVNLKQLGINTVEDNIKKILSGLNVELKDPQIITNTLELCKRKL